MRMRLWRPLCLFHVGLRIPSAMPLAACWLLDFKHFLFVSCGACGAVAWLPAAGRQFFGAPLVCGLELQFSRGCMATRRIGLAMWGSSTSIAELHACVGRRLPWISYLCCLLHCYLPTIFYTLYYSTPFINQHPLNNAVIYTLY